MSATAWSRIWRGSPPAMMSWVALAKVVVRYGYPGVGGRTVASFFDSSRKNRLGWPGFQPGTSAAASSVAGMTFCFVANAAMFFATKDVRRYSMAVALSPQLLLTAHCQEPPPILGPLPKSGGG